MRFFLHSDGNANTLNGGGRLSLEIAGKENQDKYTFNPKKPVPSFIENESDSGHNLDPGETLIAIDHRSIETREDVLVYSSDILEAPLDLIGNAHVELYASSDALDTDFTAKILDVQPDGRALRLGPIEPWPYANPLQQH